MTTFPASGIPGEDQPRSVSWWTKRAVIAHIALVIWVPGCAVAAWWQVGIALGGDSLGWVYSVMWPCFAVFGIIFWWYLVHDDPDSLGARGLRRAQEAGGGGPVAGSIAAVTSPSHDAKGGAPSPLTKGADPHDGEDSGDAELAAYNAYLASLAEQPKSWRRP